MKVLSCLNFTNWFKPNNNNNNNNNICDIIISENLQNAQTTIEGESLKGRASESQSSNSCSVIAKIFTCVAKIFSPFGDIFNFSMDKTAYEPSIEESLKDFEIQEKIY